MAVRDLVLDGDIIVLPHALERARERHVVAQGLTDDEARADIVEQVRRGIKNKWVHDAIPKSFRIGQTRPLLSWQRCVLGEGGNKAWIIALDFPPDVTVVTSLSRLAKIPRS